MNGLVRACMGVVLVAALAACPPPKGGGGGEGGGGGVGAAGVNPDACGTINTTDFGRKVYAFLIASGICRSPAVAISSSTLSNHSLDRNGNRMIRGLYSMYRPHHAVSGLHE